MDGWMECWIRGISLRFGGRGSAVTFHSSLGFWGGRERGLTAIPRVGLFATWRGVLSCRLSLFFLSLCDLGGVFTPLNCVLLRAKLSTLFNPRCRDSFSAYLANL